MMPVNQYLKANEYKGYKVNSNGEKKGLIVPILNKIWEQTEALLKIHCKVLAAHLCLRYPEGYMPKRPDNELINEWFEKLKQRLKSNRWQLKNVGYIWVKEIERSKNCHFHCVVLLDGNKVKSLGVRTANCLLREMEEAWAWALGLADTKLVYVSKTYMLKRGEREVLADHFYHASYLAKSRGKKEGTPRYGGSRLRGPATHSK